MTDRYIKYLILTAFLIDILLMSTLFYVFIGRPVWHAVDRYLKSSAIAMSQPIGVEEREYK